MLQVLANHYAAHGTAVQILTLEHTPPDYPFDQRVQIRQLLPLPPWKWLRDIALPLQLLALCYWFWRWKPKFCFSLLVRSNFINSLAGRIFPSVRTCISEHAQSTSEFSGDSFRAWAVVNLIRLLYPQADTVFCTCEGVKACLETMGVRHPRTHVVPNPIELSGVGDVNYAAELTPGLLPRIITIGRLIPQKDHVTLLSAFAIVHQQVHCELHIVGVGPLLDELRQLAGRLGIEQQVTFCGWIDDVFRCLKAGHVFALSSRWEGFGNVLVEAMACGLPVVSTECDSGPSEVLDHGRFGKLVPVGDPEALARALLELLQSPQLRRALSVQSLERASHYSVNRVAAVYESILLSDSLHERWCNAEQG